MMVHEARFRHTELHLGAGVWRFDQYIDNAKEAPDVENFWHELKRQEQQNVERLKELIRNEVKKGNF